MVKRTLEFFECDKCGREGKRYTMLYEDGAMVFDRCESHAAQMEGLRDEAGEWRDNRTSKSSFHKSTADELKRAVAADSRRTTPEQ